jgi:dTDP-4-amino-4,6-dideoxygalactose transaminase
MRLPRTGGANFGLAVTNATSGLELAMIAAGVGPGDEVITTPISWISTANAAASRGAKVVFADVDERTLNLDPASSRRRSRRERRRSCRAPLRAVLRHGRVMELARPRGITVVEDCAHATRRRIQGRRAGRWATRVFSFHQQKNMTTLGEGGRPPPATARLYERMLSYRSLCCRTYDPRASTSPLTSSNPHGKRYWFLDFDGVGYNFRMTEAQAAVGLVQLKKLDGFNARRIEIASRYTELLRGIPGLRFPMSRPR